MHKINLMKIIWLTAHLSVLTLLQPQWQIPSAVALATFWCCLFLWRWWQRPLSYSAGDDHVPVPRHIPVSSRDVEKNKIMQISNRDFILEASIVLCILSLLAAKTVHQQYSYQEESFSLPEFLESPKKSQLVEGKIEKIFQANNSKGSYRLEILATVPSAKPYSKYSSKSTVKSSHQISPGPTISEIKKPTFVYLQTANTEWIQQFYPGCHFQFLIFPGRGIRPLPEKNSFGEYLKKQRMQGMFYIKNNVRNLNCSQISIYGKTLKYIREQTRLAGFGAAAEGMATGMLLGKSGFLPIELKKQGKELGILHLFAASGLHLGILFAIFHLPLARFFGSKSRISLLIPLFLCFGYLTLLSFPVSLSRAFSFLALYAIATLTQFRMHPLSLICNSALIVFICFRGSEILSLGSALSFGAVSGILFLYPIFTRLTSQFINKDNKIFRLFLAHLSVALGAHLGTSLTILIFFQSYSFFSLVANLLLVPLASLLLPLLVCGFFIILFFQGILNGWAIVTQLIHSSSLAFPKFALPIVGDPMSSGSGSAFFLNVYAIGPLKLAGFFTQKFVELTEFLYPLSLFREYDKMSFFLPPPFLPNLILLLLLAFTPIIVSRKNPQSSRKEWNKKNCLCLLPVIVLLLFLIGPLGVLFF